MITIQENPTVNSQNHSIQKNDPHQINSNTHQQISPLHLNRKDNKKKGILLSNSPQKSLKKNSPLKKALPVKEFLYGCNKLKLKNRSQSQNKLYYPSQNYLTKENLKIDFMPIKIVKQKIQFQSNNKPKLKSFLSKKLIQSSQLKNQNQQNPQYFLKIHQNHGQTNKFTTNLKFRFTKIAEQFEERQKSFRPKLSLFQRFNYENYSNYSYKNPYNLHQPHSIASRNEKSEKYKFPMTQKYQLHKGSAKNLQIIFCQQKYPQFVEKTNEVYERFTENRPQKISKFEFLSRNQSWNSVQKASEGDEIEKKQSNTPNLPSKESHRSVSIRNLTHLNQKPNKTEPEKNNCVYSRTKILYNQNSNSKSTLQKLLNQFKTLQKLTLLQQKEHEIPTFNRFRTQNLAFDSSKTVLISLVALKFQFLKNIKKSMRNHLFKCIFEQQIINQSSKISIHGYLKFYRIFISKDASLEQLSLFLMRFLFKNSIDPNFEQAIKILQQLNPHDKKKLETFISFLKQISDKIQISYEKIIPKFLQNSHLMMLAIQLIKNE